MISTPRMAIRLASSCTVMTSGMTTSRAARACSWRAALALFAFAFAGPADRGQGAHAFDGALVVAGHGLDGQAAFAALRRALGAADRLGGGRPPLAAAPSSSSGRRSMSRAAGPRGLAGGALDFGRGGRRGRADARAAGAARAAGTARRGPAGRGASAE